MSVRPNTLCVASSCESGLAGKVTNRFMGAVFIPMECVPSEAMDLEVCS